MFDYLFFQVGPIGSAVALLVLLSVPLAFVIGHAARILAPEIKASLEELPSPLRQELHRMARMVRSPCWLRGRRRY